MDEWDGVCACGKTAMDGVKCSLGGDAPGAPTYAAGDTVFSGECRGSVVSVDDITISVAWEDADYGPITYPIEATCLRKAMPWET